MDRGNSCNLTSPCLPASTKKQGNEIVNKEEVKGREVYILAEVEKVFLLSFPLEALLCPLPHLVCVLTTRTLLSGAQQL